jgi:hypothetical protein
MCTFCNKKIEKISLLLFFLVQYEKRKLACRTLYIIVCYLLCFVYVHCFLFIFIYVPHWCVRFYAVTLVEWVTLLLWVFYVYASI